MTTRCEIGCPEARDAREGRECRGRTDVPCGIKFSLEAVITSRL
jgi:hypothetical protein